MTIYVLDANILFAALIRDGPTRELILDRDLDLHAPEWLWQETAARYAWLQEKSGMSEGALDGLLKRLHGVVTPIPEEVVAIRKEEALDLAQATGPKDAPYLAAALAVGGVLWTHDRKLAEAYPDNAIDTQSMCGEYL